MRKGGVRLWYMGNCFMRKGQNNRFIGYAMRKDGLENLEMTWKMEKKRSRGKGKRLWMSSLNWLEERDKQLNIRNYNRRQRTELWFDMKDMTQRKVWREREWVEWQCGVTWEWVLDGVMGERLWQQPSVIGETVMVEWNKMEWVLESCRHVLRKSLITFRQHFFQVWRPVDE